MSLFATHNNVMRRLVANIAPGGPSNEDKWKEKAVKSLVKRLKKTNQIEILEQAIMCRNASTSCITIPRSLDGRLQIGPKKGWPHVFYCQLWRWPDLYSQHELRPIPTCEFAFHKKASEVCVNPYHYSRIQTPSIMVPHFVPPGRGRPPNSSTNESSSGSGSLFPKEEPVSKRALPSQSGSKSFNYEVASNDTNSQFYNMESSNCHSPHSVSTLVGGPSPGIPCCASLSLNDTSGSPQFNATSIKEEAVSPEQSVKTSYSYMNECSTDYAEVDMQTGSVKNDETAMDILEDEDMKYMSSDNQSIVASTSAQDMPPSSMMDSLYPGPLSSSKFTSVEYFPMEEWCRVYYFEYNARVGDTFHCSSPHLIVDGYTNPSKNDRFCLGVLTNVKREREAETTRRHIGRGLTLYYLGGEVLVECNGSSSIFVQSPNCNYMNDWHVATVIKVPPDCNLTIFNNDVFASLLSRNVNQSYESVYELGNMCIIRISFVKGWGASYKRQSITSTPCWIEVHLNGPLQWLDRVLQQMGSSSKTCSSIS